MNIVFVVNSVMLGVGLAMDAFSVSMANGLREPRMGRRRMCVIAGVYAFFQYLMPIAGWLCVRFIVEIFAFLEKMIPWIALVLLLFIGGNMLREGMEQRHERDEETNRQRLSRAELLMQGIATSIDALSVGFTIEKYEFAMANAAALIIAVVTFILCLGGVEIGKRAGTRLSWKASVLGGCILIFIGMKIFIEGML